MKHPVFHTALLVFAAGIPGLLAQNIFTGADPGDNDWSTVLNWNPSEPTLITENVFLYDGVTADITMTGEIGNVIYVGDAFITATDARATVNMTGGDLEAISLRVGTDSDGSGTAADTTVEGTFNFLDGTILLAAQGTNSQALQVGSTSTDGVNPTTVTGTFTMGSATTSPTLTIANNRLEVGTGDGAVTALMTVKSGTITVGDGNDNIVVGQGNIDGHSTFIVGDGTGTATVTTNGTGQLNHNDGTGIVTIGDGGTLDIETLQLQNNATAPDSLVTVTTGGTLIIRSDVNDRAGGSVLQIDGGLLQLNSTTTQVREVEELLLGGSSSAGSTITIAPGSAPLRVLTAAASSVETTGTHNIQVDAVVSGDIDTEDQGTIWIAGSSAWDASGAKWAGGVAPDGVVAPGGGIPAILSEGGPLTGAGSATFAVTGAQAGAFSGVTVGSVDGVTPESLVSVNSIAGLDLGTLRAQIALPGAVITRAGDLRVARDSYHEASVGVAGFDADAQQLNFDDGTLNVSGEIVIGGLFERTENDNGGEPFDPRTYTNVGGLVNTGSFVTQSAGSITTNGIRYYGATATPNPGATAQPDLLPAFDAHIARGGVYNLTGGTLTVNGDILEGDPGTDANSASVDNAQFYVDGGSLVFNGSLIQVQSFRTGHAAGSTGDFTLVSGKTLNTTGTLILGASGTGTFTAEAGSSMTLGTNGGPIIMGDTTTGNGTFTSNGATITSFGVVIIADPGVGTAILNAGTVWTNTAGDFRVAEGDTTGSNNSSGSGFGGSGSLELNGDAAIVQSGGNFETADFNQGNRPTVTPAEGTVTVNDTAKIIVASNNYILSQQANTNGVLNMNGGTIDTSVSDLLGTPRATAGEFNINDGSGTMTMTGGLLRTGIWNLSRNNGSCDLTISGGTVEITGNLNYRGDGAGGDDSIALSGDAIFDLSGNFTANSTTNAGVGGNKLSITGSNVTFLVDGNFVADADATVTFTADAAGFSPCIATGSVGRGNVVLIIDGSALATAADMGSNNLLFEVGTTLNGVEYQDDTGTPILEGDLVGMAADGTPLLLTYTAGDGNDVALVSSLPTGDADGDGIQNLVETAFDTDPFDPSTGVEGLPVMASSGATATLQFRQLDTPGSITYTVEESTDLGQSDPWTEVASAPAVSADQSWATTNTTIYEVSVPTTTGIENYLRVSVSN